MSIEEKLLQVPQRERAGEDSDDAFAFQKDWVLHTLLKVHLSGENYVFILEYHEDVLRLDSEKPQLIEFIQVKKSDRKSWTIDRLLKVGEGKANSILGKLFQHCCTFHGEDVQLRFVSDMHFSFSTERLFAASQVLNDDKSKSIAQRIKKELPSLDEVKLDRLWFEQCEITFKGHADQLLGAVERFIIDQFGEGSKVRALSFYDTLQRKAERSRSPSDRIKTFQELKSRKGITRNEIDELISDLRIGVESKVGWEDILPYVEQVTQSHFEKILYKGTFISVDSRRKVTPDSVILNVIREVQTGLAPVSATDDSRQIVQIVNNYLQSHSPELLQCLNSRELFIIVIVVYCEKLMSASGVSS